MPVTRTPTTVRTLLSLLELFGPAVEGQEFVFDCDLPENLEALVAVLHTGIRVALSGRPWCGSADCSATRRVVAELHLDRPIPHWCGLVCVFGDTRWHRIHATARLEHPDFFGPR
jgi:hypothetical protein